MASKKQSVHVRLRNDRLELLKDIHTIQSDSLYDMGCKVPSFNSFIEGILDGYLASDAGQRMCDLVDERNRLDRERRIREKLNGAMREEDF